MVFPLRKIKQYTAVFLTVSACLALHSCGASALADRIPPAVKGGWSRSIITSIPRPEWPKDTVEAVRIAYSGPGKVDVELYQMTSGPSAFEAMQKWRAVPGKVANWKRDLFFVTVGDNPDSLRTFSESFANAIPE